MKILSKVFAAFAILLSDVCCAVVAFNYCDMLWQIKYAGTSFPASIAFLYAIPFGIGIVICAALSYVFYKKSLV